jgi:hypothetical protein
VLGGELGVVELKYSAGGQPLDRGRQRGDGASGTALVEGAAEFGEAAGFADHQSP